MPKSDNVQAKSPEPLFLITYRENQDRNTAYSLSGIRSLDLQEVFVKYCRYGALESHPAWLSGPKFGRLLQDAHLHDMLGDRIDMILTTYVENDDLKMSFTDLLRALGLVATLAYPEAPSFSEAVEHLLQEHILCLIQSGDFDNHDTAAPTLVNEDDGTTLNQDDEITPTSMAQHKGEDLEHSSTSVLMHAVFKGPQEAPIQSCLDEDSSQDEHSHMSHASNSEFFQISPGRDSSSLVQSCIYSHGSSDVSNGDQENSDNQILVQNSCSASVYSSQDETEVDSVNCALSVTPSLCSSGMDSSTTAGTPGQSIGTDALPLDPSECLRGDAGPQIVNLDVKQVNLLRDIFHQYTPHWCTADGKNIASKRCLRNPGMEFAVHTSKTVKARKRPRFMWSTTMCFGGFLSFVQDFQISCAKSEHVMQSFVAALGTRPLQIRSHKGLDFSAFVHAATGLAALEAKSRAQRTFIPFGLAVRTLIEKCERLYIANRCISPGVCVSCIELNHRGKADTRWMPQICAEDAATLALLDKVQDPLQTIFAHYCDHSSIGNISIDPCRGGQCGGPQPLLPECAFWAFCRDFEVGPRFLNRAQLCSIFQQMVFTSRSHRKQVLSLQESQGEISPRHQNAHAHEHADDEVALDTIYSTSTTSLADACIASSGAKDIVSAGISYPEFLGVLLYAAIKGLSKYPYDHLASSTHEKVALFLQRLQISPSFCKILGHRASLNLGTPKSKQNRCQTASTHHGNNGPHTATSCPPYSRRSPSTVGETESKVPPPPRPPRQDQLQQQSSVAVHRASDRPRRQSVGSISIISGPIEGVAFNCFEGISVCSKYSDTSSTASSECSVAPVSQAERRRHLQAEYDLALRRSQSQQRSRKLQQNARSSAQTSLSSHGPKEASTARKDLRSVNLRAKPPKAEPIRSLFAPRNSAEAVRRRTASRGVVNKLPTTTRKSENASNTLGRLGESEISDEGLTLEEKIQHAFQ